MRRRAKAKESNAIAGLDAGHSQAAKADDAGAEKRRGVQVVQLGRKLEDKVAARYGVLRVAAVDGVSGKDRRIAKIFESAATVRAGSIYAADPGNTYAGAERKLGRSAVYYITYDLVAGDQGLHARGQFAFDDVQIGAADAARAHPQQDLIR